jgi:hypothetical protein
MWLDDRVGDVCPEHVPGRLYGLGIVDDLGIIEGLDGAVRLTGLGDGYAYDLLTGPAGVLATGFDALGLVCHGWLGDYSDPTIAVRPSQHPDRRRVRSVTVADGTAEQATVIHLLDTGERRLVGRGGGGIPDALDLLYGLVPPRARRRCGR